MVHGRYRIKLCKDIIYCTLEEATNAELFKEFQTTLDKIRPQVIKPWFMVLDLRGWELAPLDVFEDVYRHSRDMEKNPHKAQAVIIMTDKIIQKSVLQNKLHTESNSQFMFCKTADELVDILRSKNSLGVKCLQEYLLESNNETA